MMRKKEERTSERCFNRNWLYLFEVNVFVKVLADVNLEEETKRANKEEEAHRQRLLKKQKEVRSRLFYPIYNYFRS